MIRRALRGAVPLLVAVALLLVAAPAARATTLHPFTDDELAWVAETIVVGTVLSVGSAVGPRGQFPYTYARIRVEQAWKGEARPGAEVVVRELGGETPDGRVAFVPASAQFDAGERVVLFLEPAAEAGTWSCVGMFQGKYTLRTDAASGRTVAFRVHSNAWTGTYDHRAVAVPGSARDGDALAAHVRSLVGAGEVPPYRPIPGLREEKRREFEAFWGIAPREESP